MEIYCYLLVFLGAVAVALRASWAERPTLALLIAAAWAFLPWSTSDLAAQSNLGRVRAWVQVPDHAEGIAAALLTEAVVTGGLALRLTESTAETKAARTRRLVRSLGAAAPSPALGLGVVSVQLMLFHHVSGRGFGLLNGAVSVGTFLGLAGLSLGFRAVFRRPGRRAELAVLASIGLFVLGGALPLIVRRPSTHVAPVSVDLRSTAAFAALALGTAGVGLAARWVGISPRGRKGTVS